MVVSGAVSAFASQTREFSVNRLLVASSNSYRVAPVTLFQAKDGVRAYVRPAAGVSSDARRKARTFCGAAGAALATGAATSAHRKRAARRGAMLLPVVGRPRG